MRLLFKCLWGNRVACYGQQKKKKKKETQTNSWRRGTAAARLTRESTAKRWYQKGWSRWGTGRRKRENWMRVNKNDRNRIRRRFRLLLLFFSGCKVQLDGVAATTPQSSSSSSSSWSYSNVPFSALLYSSLLSCSMQQQQQLHDDILSLNQHNNDL